MSRNSFVEKLAATSSVDKILQERLLVPRKKPTKPPLRFDSGEKTHEGDSPQHPQENKYDSSPR